MTKIKICGIRRTKDAEFLNSYPPDYTGFILSQQFKRSISYEQLENISKALTGKIKRVGVFVNESYEYIMRYAPLLDVVQLHGNENNDLILRLKKSTSCEIWKAVRVKSEDDIVAACALSADKLVLDSFSDNSYGGTGKTADWSLIKNTDISKPFFIAGGINEENCISVINTLNPYGIDLSSSVETNGYKDESKIKKIILKLRIN